MGKSAPRNRAYAFTSWSDDEPKWNPRACRYLVWQRERGEEKKGQHHQGYIYFYNPISIAVAKKYLPEGSHVEVARGTAADNRSYCSRDDKRVEGTAYHEHGELPAGQGERLG